MRSFGPANNSLIGIQPLEVAAEYVRTGGNLLDYAPAREVSRVSRARAICARAREARSRARSRNCAGLRAGEAGGGQVEGRWRAGGLDLGGRTG